MSTSPLHKDELRLTASNNSECIESGPVENARSHATGPRDELQAILERAMDEMEATGAAIALSTEEGVFCQASVGDLAPEVGTPLHAGVGLAGRCLSTGGIQLCNDTHADSRLDPEVSEALGIGSVLMLPIKQNSLVVGVLGVLSNKPNAFNETLVALAGEFAERVSSLVLARETLQHHHNLVEPSTTTRGLADPMDLQRLLEAAYVLQDKDRIGNMEAAETLEPSGDSPHSCEAVAATSGAWSRVRAFEIPRNWPFDQPRLSVCAAAITKLWNRIPSLGKPQSAYARLLALAGPLLLVGIVLLGRLAFVRHSHPAGLQTPAVAAPAMPLDRTVATDSPDLLTSPGPTASEALNKSGGTSSAIDHGNIQNIDDAQAPPVGKVSDPAPATDSAAARAVQEIDVDAGPRDCTTDRRLTGERFGLASRCSLRTREPPASCNGHLRGRYRGKAATTGKPSLSSASARAATGRLGSAAWSGGRKRNYPGSERGQRAWAAGVCRIRCGCPMALPTISPQRQTDTHAHGVQTGIQAAVRSICDPLSAVELENQCTGNRTGGSPSAGAIRPAIAANLRETFAMRRWFPWAVPQAPSAQCPSAR